MELQRVEPAGGLVKATPPQDKLAFGLGAASIGLMLFAGGFWPIAAALGALLLSWESVTSRDKRTALATTGFALGLAPLGYAAFGLAQFALGFALHLAILFVLAGGAYFGGRALLRRSHA